VEKRAVVNTPKEKKAHVEASKVVDKSRTERAVVNTGQQEDKIVQKEDCQQELFREEQ